jgi:hypothetical protein
MSSFSKIVFLTSLLILTSSAVLVGCAQKAPALEEIVASTVAAMTQVGTYKYDLDMNIDTAQQVSGGENTTMKSVVTANGTLDVAKKEMHTTLDYSGSLQGQLTSKLPPLEFSMRPLLSLECFATGNESYMKLGVPSLSGEHWTKSGFDAWGYLDQAAQQIELLKTAGEVDLLGMENVNSINCYILKTTPDGEKLAEWLSRQLALISLGNLQAKKEDLNSFSIKLWIARDKYLLTKMEFELTQQERNSDVDMKGRINFYDYNQPVSIIIPQEVINAREAVTPK